MEYAISAKENAPDDWQEKVKSVNGIKVSFKSKKSMIVTGSKFSIELINSLGFCTTDKIDIKMPPGTSI